MSILENTPTPNSSCPFLYPNDEVTFSFRNNISIETVIKATVIAPDFSKGSLARGFRVTLLNNLTLVSSDDSLAPSSGYPLLQYIFANYVSPLNNGRSATPVGIDHSQYKDGPLINRTYDINSPMLKCNIHNPFAVNDDFIINMPDDLIVMTCDYEAGGNYPYPIEQPPL